MGVSGAATTVRRAKGRIAGRARHRATRAICRTSRGLSRRSTRKRLTSATPPSSEALHSNDMLHLGRGLEAVADELAPLLKVGRLTEIHRVVVQRLPLDKQAVAARLFDPPPRLPTRAAPRPPEQPDPPPHSRPPTPLPARRGLG